MGDVERDLGASERARVNEIGRLLQTVLAGDDAIVVAIGAHGPSTDCRYGHVSATVTQGQDTATGEAVSLIDAIGIARGMNAAAAEKRRKEAAEAKDTSHDQ